MERKVDQLSDAEFVALVQKEVKKRRDAIAQFEKGGARNSRRRSKTKSGSWKVFFRNVVGQELEDLVRAAIEETGARDSKQMGVVIKAVQARAAGRADGKRISGSLGDCWRRKSRHPPCGLFHGRNLLWLVIVIS